MANGADSDVSDVAARWMFLRALKACRLFTDRQVDDYVDRHPDASLSQLKALLVGDGLLSPYQLKQITSRNGEGLVIGQYHVQAELGRGGFGVVYLARHALMHRQVALKVIGDHWGNDPAGREYFLREVSGCTRLSHPNIAMPYDAGEVDGRLYLAMEYVDGPTLDAYLTARGPLDAAGLVAVLTQTADALRHADDRGVVHRDLKPANLLLTGGNPFTVKVIDYGLARFFSREVQPVGTLLCESGAVVGTPAYMPPEQANDVHDADIRSDLYSLGCTLYHSATGRVPFAGRTTRDILEAVAAGAVTPVSLFRPDLPAWLTDTIQRLMARRPDDRFQTPGEVLDIVADCQTPRTPAPAPPPPEPKPEPEPVLLVVSAVAPSAVNADPTEVTPAAEARSVEDFAPWWQEWHRQVGRLASGHSPELSDTEYRALQRLLLRAVRGATDGPAVEHRHRLLAAVEPWVSLKALSALDHRTLGDVWAECQKLDAAVTPRRSRRWW